MTVAVPDTEGRERAMTEDQYAQYALESSGRMLADRRESRV